MKPRAAASGRPGSASTDALTCSADGIGEPACEIDEVAALAEQAAAAFLGIVEPVVVGQRAGVDAVHELERLAAEVVAQLGGQRREAAVEPDGEQPSGLRPRAREASSSSLVVQRRRLLDEDGLAGPQGLGRERRVRVVPRRDGDEADVPGRRRSPPAARRARRRARSAAARAESPLELATERSWKPARCRPGIRIRVAKLPAPITPTAPAPSDGLVAAGAGARWASSGPRLVLEHDAERRALGADAAVRTPRGACVDGDALGDERLDVDLPGRDELEKRGHVAPLGPADVADRIVEPALLVLAVVAARPVRARHAQLELLLVVRGARHLHPDVADDHDAAAVAAELARRARPGRRSSSRR